MADPGATRLLALDPSTTPVGWCLSADGEYLDSGVYVPQGADWVDRVFDIEVWLSDLDQEYDAVALELGAVEWVIRRFARQALDDALIAVTAAEVKESGCHKDALSVAASIAGRCMCPGHKGDEADAIGVMLAAWKKLRERDWQRRARGERDEPDKG